MKRSILIILLGIFAFQTAWTQESIYLLDSVVYSSFDKPDKSYFKKAVFQYDKNGSIVQYQTWWEGLKYNFTVKFVNDAKGRAVSKKQIVTGGTAFESENKDIKYTWAANGKLASMQVKNPVFTGMYQTTGFENITFTYLNNKLSAKNFNSYQQQTGKSKEYVSDSRILTKYLPNNLVETITEFKFATWTEDSRIQSYYNEKNNIVKEVRLKRPDAKVLKFDTTAVFNYLYDASDNLIQHSTFDKNKKEKILAKYFYEKGLLTEITESKAGRYRYDLQGRLSYFYFFDNMKYEYKIEYDDNGSVKRITSNDFKGKSHDYYFSPKVVANKGTIKYFDIFALSVFYGFAEPAKVEFYSLENELLFVANVIDPSQVLITRHVQLFELSYIKIKYASKTEIVEFLPYR